MTRPVVVETQVKFTEKQIIAFIEISKKLLDESNQSLDWPANRSKQWFRREFPFLASILDENKIPRRRHRKIG